MKNLEDKIFKNFTFFISLIPVFVLISLFVFLLIYSIPSIKYNGLTFFTSYLWYPGQFNQPPIMKNGVMAPYGSNFGSLLFILGTILTSLLAIIIVLPLSLFLSITIHLYIPYRLRKIVYNMVQIFAAIPSVVYGLWGIVVLEPFLYYYLEPFLRDTLGFIPFFSGDIYSGAGIIASTIILTIMVLPITTAVIMDRFESMPEIIVNGAFALGATRWEVAKNILVKFSSKQILGGTLLGLARAIGETMAVLMVSGFALNILPSNIYSPINTMAAAIAALLDSAFIDPTNMNLYALSELGLVLLIISMIVNIIGRTIVGRGVIRGSFE